MSADFLSGHGAAWNILALAGIGVAPILVPWIALGLLERVMPAGKLKRATDWMLDIKIALLYLSVPTLLAAAIAGLVAAARAVNGGGLINLTPGYTGGFAVAVNCALYLLIWDFFYYWWHRAQHRWSSLWAMHKLHHLDERLGVTTQMRVHWLEELGRIPAIALPMALIFDLPVHGGVVAAVLTAWTAFIHANLRLSMGPLTAALVGPQVHRIHHSVEPQHRDRNFAAFFPIYDIMFGTYYHPARSEFPETGVVGERDVSGLREAAILPFRRRIPDASGGQLKTY